MSPSRGAAAPKASDAVPVFVALGDPIRLRLLGRLSADGPLSITRLSRGSGVTRQAITKHLHTLGAAGLVRHARRGRERLWELDRDRKSTRLNSSHRTISYAVFCLKKKKKKK